VKALPLWQPWASLVAVEAKRIETRHWPAPQRLIGQRIAIHATKTEREMWIVGTTPFAERLMAALDAGTLVEVDGKLPLGAVIATAVIDRCSRMTPESIAALRECDPDEHAFGHYEPGRFAWVLRDVERLVVPVPFRGSQGIFDVPDELLGLPPTPRPAHEQGALL
jgi:hypothetical protein